MAQFETVLPFVDQRSRQRMTEHLVNVFSSVRGEISDDRDTQLSIRTAALDDWWFSRIRGRGDLTMIAGNLDLFSSHAILLLNECGDNRRLNYKPLFPPAGQITLGLSSPTDSAASSGEYGYLCIYLPIDSLESTCDGDVPYGHSLAIGQGAGRVLSSAMHSLANEVIEGQDTASLTKILPSFSNLMANALRDPEGMEMYSLRSMSRRNRIYNYLQRHFLNPEINAEGVAEAIGVSRRQLDRECAQLGSSFSTLLRELRLKRACHLFLANPECNITQVAYEVGFSCPTVFGRLFKKSFGISPRQFCHRRYLSLAVNQAPS